MERRAARFALVSCVVVLAALTPLFAALNSGAISVARAQPSPSPSGSASPSTSPSASPSGSPSGSPSASPSGSPARSPSASPSGSPTGSPVQQSRTISLFASDNEVAAGDSVDFEGRIFAPGQGCAGRDEFVRLQRRMVGEEAFENFRSTLTGVDGDYRFEDVEVERSADYRALAPSHDNCAEAQSPTETVTVQGRVTIRANDETPKRGSIVRISGTVQPSEPNSKVRLQQRRGGGWETVLGDRLDGRSRYLFEFEATGPKTQRYRVRWLGSDQNEPATSEVLTLRLHK